MPSRMGTFSPSASHGKHRVEQKLYVPPHLRGRKEAPSITTKEVVPRPEESRVDVKQWVPPHLRGIIKEPTVAVVAPTPLKETLAVVAPIPLKETHADVVPALPIHSPVLPETPVVKKEGWIPPHLRFSRGSRDTPVVEQKSVELQVRRVFKYGKCRYMVFYDWLNIGSVPALAFIEWQARPLRAALHMFEVFRWKANDHCGTFRL